MRNKKSICPFLASILSLFGFSSCILAPTMYGSPYVEFAASGKVTDKQGEPIEGIRVAVREHRYYPNSENVIYDHNHWYDDDTLYTDAQGRYQLTRDLVSFSGPDDVTIVFEDIDGPGNGGEFAPATVIPEITQTKKGDKKWYGGKFEVSADVSLEKK